MNTARRMITGLSTQPDDLPVTVPIARWTRVIVAFVFFVILAGSGLWVFQSTTTPASTIFGSSAPERVAERSDARGVEVGTRFTARTDGVATGMRFWKVPKMVGPHSGTLWTAEGRSLARASFTGETSSGWQSVVFDQEISLEKGQTYVVSYHAATGDYAVTEGFTGMSHSPYLTIDPDFGVFRYGTDTLFPTGTYNASSYWVDVAFEPQPGVVPDPPLDEGFPSADTTGVPEGTELTAYSGPCRITKPETVIDAKKVTCWPLLVDAPGVVITRSLVEGFVSNPESGTGSFTITDSEVTASNSAGTGIGDARFTAMRVEVTGGNRSVNCFLDCTIQDSYVHGQFRDATGYFHESGIRMGSNSVIRGNTIACDAPNVPPAAGCSAALTGYGDFAVVQNNVIDGNLFVGGSGGYCSYGGSTGGKEFSEATRDIRFTNNVWQRGSTGKCGAYGPISSFDSGAPGNVWTNNRWADGDPVLAG